MKTITIPLELAERIAARLEEVINPRLDKDLFDELKPLMETQAPEYHHIWEGSYMGREGELKTIPPHLQTLCDQIESKEDYIHFLQETKKHFDSVVYGDAIG